MRAQLWRAIYESTFYLPGVQRELALLETQAERDRARWHVWRHLFASWRYWALCAVVIGVMLPALAAALPLARLAAAAFQVQGKSFEAWFFIIYSMTLAVAFAYGGMWPLRRMVLDRLRGHLRELGIPVCVSCGYDLRGQTTSRCPECGTPFEPIAAAKAG